jgi:16S rRNA (cytosine1402-N4)-methyltransferase
MLIGFDRDVRNLNIAKENLKKDMGRVVFIRDSFGNLAKHGIEPVDAILFDLGYSSAHVDDPTRGFSLRKEGPLDMRYDTEQDLKAEDIVNGWSKDNLSALFREFGEETRSDKIATAIVRARKKDRITSTTALAEIIDGTVRRIGKIHPATQAFQALRIAVNDEFGEIERGLAAAIDLLKPEGRIAVLTFHSLEDRLVKQFLKGEDRVEAVNRKVIKPTYKEKQKNRRARSAKLRIVRRSV